VWKGFESAVLILITDVLRSAKEDFLAVYESEILIDKSNQEVPLWQGNVWADPNSVEMDGEYIKLDFLILGPEEKEALDNLNKSQRSLHNIQEEEEIPEEKPWYGDNRYQIVDHVLSMQEEAERKMQRSAV